MITLHDSGGYFKMHWELFENYFMPWESKFFLEYIIEVYPILKCKRVINGIEYRELSTGFINEKIQNFGTEKTIAKRLKPLIENDLLSVIHLDSNGNECEHGRRFIHLNTVSITDDTPDGKGDGIPDGKGDGIPDGKGDGMGDVANVQQKKLRNQEIKEPKETEDINQFKNEIEDITNYFNIKCNTKYKSEVISNNCSIIEILNAGYTVDNFKTVIDKKYEDWKDDSKMAQFIRPATLFKNVSKFDEYLNAYSSKSLPKKKFSLYGENRDDRGNIIDPSKEPEIVKLPLPF